jgi:dipeptidyl aminopeptidase/acylaminoacyl peptidase
MIGGLPLLRLKLVCLSITACLLASRMYAQTRAFTVRDSIELTTFNVPSELAPDSRPIFSPDGKHFLIVTSRGIVDADKIESKLWVYDIDSVRKFLASDARSSELRPRLLVAVLGSPIASTLDNYGALITEARWSADSRRVYFLRQSTTGDHELYEVDRRTALAKRLTPGGYDVAKFDVNAQMSVALLSSPIHDKGETATFFGGEINKDARAVTGLPISTILFPHAPGRWHELRETRMWIAELGKSGHLISGGNNSQIDLGVVDQLSISPKGRWLVRLLPVNSIPRDWANYEPNPTLSYIRIRPEDPYATSPTNLLRLKSYAMIDLHTGKELFRVNGPNARPLGLGIVDQAVWSRDRKRLLLTNTYLPLEGVTEEMRQQRLHPCVVLDVEIPSTKLRCIVFSRVPSSRAEPPWLRAVTFGESKDEVVLQYLGSSMERYRLAGDHWIPEESLAEHEAPARNIPSDAGDSMSQLKITIRQSLNSSPVLWAENVGTGQSRALWDPNPQLSHMKLGEVTEYRWEDGNGIEWVGGLIKPVDYVAGKRYPLVIQTHGFSENNFKGVTDGAFPTAMAARPLASAGIMVLQIPDYQGKKVVTTAEAEQYVEGYRSAIAQLTSEGLIDPKRIGIIGFSRTCWHVETALIEFPALFAAATIADGVDESYMQYHLFFDATSHRTEFERINQAKPVGDGLKKWLELAPGFRLEKVATPLRIEAIGHNSVLAEWEIYSSLRMREAPVDLVYIPRGQHVLQRPLDRMASQQGNVDWFEFWLEGSGASEPARNNEYRRWQAMRKKLAPVK